MLILKIILILAAILLLLFLGTGIFMFRFIFARPKRSTKIPKSYIGTPHYNASKAGVDLLKSLPCEDVFLTSRDGLKLHAYLYPAENGKMEKFILGIHGFKSYSRPEFGPYVKFYRSLGYSILLPDDRAHAPSEGKYIGFGVLDRLDCVDWAKYLVSRFGAGTEIRLHGVSMGAATVLAASGEEELPAEVRGIVADCGYSSAWDVLSAQLHLMHIPTKPTMQICEALCRRFAGFGFHEHTPVEQVRHAKVPILFVHGAKDQMVPVRMAHELYDACGSEKRLLIIDEAAHAESSALAPQKYQETILDFFHLQKADPSAD